MAKERTYKVYGRCNTCRSLAYATLEKGKKPKWDLYKCPNCGNVGFSLVDPPGMVTVTERPVSLAELIFGRTL